MSDVITFGTTLWAQAQGSYSFVRGFIKRRWAFEPMLRADGEIPKALGLSGCDHTLTLIYQAVPSGQVGAIFTRIEDLAQGMVEDTLSIPSWGDFPNCVCTDVQPTPQTLALKTLALNELGSAIERSYNLEFVLTFHQSRP